MKRLTKFQEKQLAYLNEHKGITPSNGQRWWGLNVLNGCWEAFEKNGYTTRTEDAWRHTILTEKGLAYLEKYKPDWKELHLDTQKLREHDKAQLVYAFQNNGSINWHSGTYKVNCTYKRLRAHNLISSSYGNSKLYLRELGNRYARMIQSDVDMSTLERS